MPNYGMNPFGSSEKTPKICIIGAGFSGICAAVQLRKQLPSIEFTIFEENKEVGGTWYMNTYPGAAPDISSHLYSYSFEPNPSWSHSYSPQEEVLQYLKNIANKYDLYSRTKFNHTVEQLKWDERRLCWQVIILNRDTNQSQEILFDFVITAHGRFHLPKIPEEFSAFTGPKMHSAEWNKDIDLNGKNVAVIGSASSAAQIIPNIAGKVKNLLVYQRHACWVVPRFQFRFPEIAKWTLETVPGLSWAYRIYLYWLYQTSAPCFRPDTLGNKFAKLLGKFHLWNQVKDPKVREKLTPDYEFGCKRVTPTSEYYPTFNMPNVKLITSKISQVNNDSILTEDGEKEKIDVLILATGFRVQDSFGSMEIRGENSKDLFRSWVNERPRTYLNIMNSTTPNLFILLGPNSAIGYTSILFSLECQVHWVISVLKEMNKNSWRCVKVKKSAEDSYMNELDERSKNTIIGSGSCGGCDTWYINSKGVITELFPGTTKAYWEKTKDVKLNDLEFQ